MALFILQNHVLEKFKQSLKKTAPKRKRRGAKQLGWRAKWELAKINGQN